MSQINIKLTDETEVTTPTSGQVAIFADDIDKVGVKNSSGTVSYFTGINAVQSEIITLSSGMITAKQVTLVGTPKTNQGVLVVPKNGPPQVQDLDYTISGQVVSWDGLGMDGVLEENDILAVYY